MTTAREVRLLPLPSRTGLFQMSFSTMRAVQRSDGASPGRFVLRAVAVPEPSANEVRVRVAACGICRTELHLRDGLLDLGARDFTVGHEIAGTIDAVGDGVPAARIGERVAVYYYEGCGTCRWCRTGDEQLCLRPCRQPGFSSDGGYAEHLVVRARNCVPLPDGLGFAEAAPLGCAGTTAVHAARLATLEAGEWVVVNALGGVGLALIAYAAHLGARVIAVARGEGRAALCRELGAAHVLEGRNATDPVVSVMALTGGEGAAVVFELPGTAGSMAASVAMLARRGRMVLIGYTADSLPVHPVSLIVKEASLIGSVGATLEDLRVAVSLAGRGVLRIPVDRCLPLERFAEGLALIQAGGLAGRIVLRPDDTGEVA
ncbi:alcohol dehydrogenase catalytic domain-containing protein [Rhizosaccharibacter radicis]|uniref:alcohol dehydrogenase n=1 Tax=Rhizosaccharibacter radicis TaxID=2782605 RepID=A0ABT1W178_9PROT|nr:alcohol dehydrogenase catalytic domain-containing protein [Acetobacteraceae bacterium KSS12]